MADPVDKEVERTEDQIDKVKNTEAEAEELPKLKKTQNGLPYSSCIYTINRETKPNKVAKVVTDLVMTCKQNEIDWVHLFCIVIEKRKDSV